MDQKTFDGQGVKARFHENYRYVAMTTIGAHVRKFSSYLLILCVLCFAYACSDDERGRRNNTANNSINDSDAQSVNNDTDTHPEQDFDSDSDPDSDPDFDPDFDPDGTQYPLDKQNRFIHGTFERSDAAFDGIRQQSAEQSATMQLDNRDQKESFMVGNEWDCHVRLRRVNIVAPTDSPFLTHEGTAQPGTVYLLGKHDLVFDFWQEIASMPFDADTKEISFLPEDLAAIAPQYALAVAFEADSAQGTVHIAEVEIFGYCTNAETPVAWQIGDWYCSAECSKPEANAGESVRQVKCEREGNSAYTPICEQQATKPSTFNGPCQLNCGYQLKFIGYREFTYSNNSGWLHEGSKNSPTRRAGPMPYAVSHGKTVAEIDGKPCSIQTPASEPDRYFIGIACQETDGNGQTISGSYCAFRCE